jgi:drug/metabolite transporter (DMT)-like permease
MSALTPSPKLRWLAILAMMTSVCIYGANFVISRYAVLNGFTPYDLAALRFGGAGLLLLPLFLKSGGFANCAGIGWGRGLALAVMSGAPMSLLQMVGLTFAPAAHGATIGPGIVSVISMLAGVYLFGVRPGKQAILGMCLAVVGLIIFASASGLTGTREMIIGDLLFLAMALVWGGYPVALQKWRVNPLVATSVLSVVSLAYLPFYWLFLPSNLANIPLLLILLHTFNQAVLNMIVGLWLWGWAAQTIGTSESGKFPPLIPVIGTCLAIPLIGEWPSPLQATAIACIVFGLLVMALDAKAKTS